MNEELIEFSFVIDKITGNGYYIYTKRTDDVKYFFLKHGDERIPVSEEENQRLNELYFDMSLVKHTYRSIKRTIAGILVTINVFTLSSLINFEKIDLKKHNPYCNKKIEFYLANKEQFNIDKAIEQIITEETVLSDEDIIFDKMIKWCGYEVYKGFLENYKDKIVSFATPVQQKQFLDGSYLQQFNDKYKHMIAIEDMLAELDKTDIILMYESSFGIKIKDSDLFFEFLRTYYNYYITSYFSVEDYNDYVALDSKEFSVRDIDSIINEWNLEEYREYIMREPEFFLDVYKSLLKNQNMSDEDKRIYLSDMERFHDHKRYYDLKVVAKRYSNVENRYNQVLSLENDNDEDLSKPKDIAEYKFQPSDFGGKYLILYTDSDYIVTLDAKAHEKGHLDTIGETFQTDLTYRDYYYDKENNIFYPEEKPGTVRYVLESGMINEGINEIVIDAYFDTDKSKKDFEKFKDITFALRYIIGQDPLMYGYTSSKRYLPTFNYLLEQGVSADMVLEITNRWWLLHSIEKNRPMDFDNVTATYQVIEDLVYLYETVLKNDWREDKVFLLLLDNIQSTYNNINLKNYVKDRGEDSICSDLFDIKIDQFYENIPEIKELFSLLINDGYRRTNVSYSLDRSIKDENSLVMDCSFAVYDSLANEKLFTIYYGFDVNEMRLTYIDKQEMELKLELGLN